MNLFYQVVAVALLLPCVALASEESTNWGVIQEDTDSYRLGRERLERFREINPFLHEEVGPTLSFKRACVPLNRNCIRFLRDEKADARQAVPDNPEYWQSYHDLLEVTPLARLASEANEITDTQKIISATRYWPMHQLLVGEVLDAKDVHFVVSAHRRLLAESNFMIDKMIQIATAGISLQAINILMAQHAHSLQPLAPAEAKMLDEALQPMTIAEYSMRRVLHGESLYVAYLIKDGANITESQVEDYHQIYSYVANRSEASWADLWSRGLDLRADVPVSSLDIEFMAPGYSSYVSYIRHLDASLYVLRALREIYEGRISPGIPAQPSPPRWYWEWQVANQALCLAPGDIHFSFGNAPTICVDYLEEPDVAM